MKSKHILGIIAAVLAILLLLTGYWGYTLSNEKKGLMSKNESLEAQISDMRQLKDELTREVDSLEQAYTLLAEENGELQGSLEEAKKTIASRNSSIRKLKASNQTSQDEMGNLRSQIVALMQDKQTLEASINRLVAQNDSLRNLAGVLEQDLSKVRGEKDALANLNQTMQDEINRLTLSNFQASAFQVEVEKKRKSKVTSKSRRARRIRVSFDLTNVPEKYQGVRPVFLSITDENGTPIKIDNPIQAKVVVNGQTMDIIAAEKKEISLTENQRLSFTHDLAQKLGSGYYRAIAYTDIGVLGASSFRLR
ncbi:MAG: hypothetical protein AAFV95_02760 [Bacteroidota bacterium]